MTFESMVSFSESNNNPITEFSDFFKKRNPGCIKLIEDHKTEIAVISGQGYKVSWMEKHDCDCPFCDIEEESTSRFFTSKKEAEEQVKHLKEYPSEYWDIKIKLDAYFVKAVKQVNVLGGLF